MIRRSHGLSRVPEYVVWKTMRQRCNNPKNVKYPRYGARGISVCSRWDDFSLFLSDMGKRPSANHTIERINNDGNYEPGNCEWRLQKTQQNNRSNNRVIVCDGKSHTLAEWAEILGVSQDFLHNRVHRGWSDERIIKEPKFNRGQK